MHFLMLPNILMLSFYRRVSSSCFETTQWNSPLSRQPFAVSDVAEHFNAPLFIHVFLRLVLKQRHITTLAIAGHFYALFFFFFFFDGVYLRLILKQCHESVYYHVNYLLFLMSLYISMLSFFGVFFHLVLKQRHTKAKHKQKQTKTKKWSRELYVQTQMLLNIWMLYLSAYCFSLFWNNSMNRSCQLCKDWSCSQQVSDSLKNIYLFFA